MLKNFEAMIKQIQKEIYTMSQKVVNANTLALDAIEKKDVKAFQKSRSELNHLGDMSNEIDNIILKALALHQPEAKHLRSLVSYLKITNEIVRAGTNTKNFIKNFSKSFHNETNLESIFEFSIPLQKASIEAMKITSTMIKMKDKESIENAFQQVIVEENKTDDLYAMVEKNLLKILSKDKELSKEYLDILSSLRRLEKIADRASSIANLLVFAYVGGSFNQV